VVEKLVFYFALGTLVTFPGYADFEAGLAAYDRHDYAAAAQEWQPIAQAGDANAQYNMGLLFASGQGGPQDYRKAAEWYRKAAEQGVVAAEYNLGVLYANGQGVPRSDQDAAEWLQKAAENGVVSAAASLGDIYSDDKGALHNFEQAAKWYRIAAEKGVASAQFGLGLMYDLGQGVAQDYQQAIDWYTKAAEAGYAPAMTNLGILYYNAQGGKRDLVQAYAWIERAKKLGEPRADELIETTAERMNKRDVKRAEALVDEWHPSNHPKPELEEAKLFKQPAAAPASGAPASGAPASGMPAGTSPASAVPVNSPANGAPINHDSADHKAGTATQDVWTGVDRVIAIGDIHGDFEQFVKVLQSADLIDASGNWMGGKAHLVQTGDVAGRGPDARAIMDLLMKLEKQAADAGGGVHALIGNEEAMDISGDLRDVSSAELAAFHTGTETAPDGAHPPGYAQWREAFGPNGVYGHWIRSHNTAIKIDRTLFVHAGISSKYADWSLERINDDVRQELNDVSPLDGGMVKDDAGPLRWPDLARGDETRLAPLVDQLLKHFDVDRIVIGHTNASGAITPRFGGKVLLIDIGLSRTDNHLPAVGCLEIDQNHAYALDRGQGIELPSDENGPDMLRYLKQAAALDPKPSPLEPRIRALEASRAPGN
jgi:TPR repeat protein